MNINRKKYMKNSIDNNNNNSYNVNNCHSNTSNINNNNVDEFANQAKNLLNNAWNSL